MTENKFEEYDKLLNLVSQSAKALGLEEETCHIYILGKSEEANKIKDLLEHRLIYVRGMFDPDVYNDSNNKLDDLVVNGNKIQGKLIIIPDRFTSTDVDGICRHANKVLYYEDIKKFSRKIPAIPWIEKLWSIEGVDYQSVEIQRLIKKLENVIVTLCKTYQMKLDV